jgi:hypothetical protein
VRRAPPIVLTYEERGTLLTLGSRSQGAPSTHPPIRAPPDPSRDREEADRAAQPHFAALRGAAKVGG